MLPVFHDDDGGGGDDNDDDDGGDDDDDDDDDNDDDDDVHAWPLPPVQLVRVLVVCLHYQYSVMMVVMMMIMMIMLMMVTMMMMTMMMMVLVRGPFCQFILFVYSLSVVATSVP